jgi:hypothetical protein
MLDTPERLRSNGAPFFNRLPRIEHERIDIFRAFQPDAGFNMHPYITHFDGRFWAMWSSNEIRDLQSGQFVRYATSVDGVTWSESAPVMPGEEGWRYFARGFWVRDGELFALAARDEVVRPLFGPSLELRGYRWNPDTKAWDDPIVIHDDTINNFPPKQLPGGEWLMSRRDHKNEAYMLVGGVTAPTDWKVLDVPTPTDGGKLNEPFWWALPDGTLAAAFRDGSKSRRLYRAFSTNQGRTWSTPVQTNFPDATAKFNTLRLKDGRYAMASCPNPTGVRIPICLSLSAGGVVFTRMAILRDAATIWRYAGKDLGYAGYHYPQLLEHDGALYVIHSENMEDIIVLRIPLAELDALLPAE